MCSENCEMDDWNFIGKVSRRLETDELEGTIKEYRTETTTEVVEKLEVNLSARFNDK